MTDNSKMKILYVYFADAHLRLCLRLLFVRRCIYCPQPGRSQCQRQDGNTCRHSVTDQEGRDNTGRTSSPGHKNESFSAVSSAFYPLRMAVKPLHPPTAGFVLPSPPPLPPPLSHTPPFKIISPSFAVSSSLYSLLHLLPSTIIFWSPGRLLLLLLLRLPSFFHLFSTLSFPLLTLSEIDFQLRAECLEASIFPNLTPIQPKWHPTHQQNTHTHTHTHTHTSDTLPPPLTA